MVSTAYSDIFKRFADNLSEEDAGQVDLLTRRQFLRNSLALFAATVRPVHPNNDEGFIEEDLNMVEMMLLGLFMYDLYLDQQIISYNKIINISNELIKITGATDRVKTLKDMKLLNQQKINSILSVMYY